MYSTPEWQERDRKVGEGGPVVREMQLTHVYHHHRAGHS